MGRQHLEIGHVHLKVRNLDRARKFYTTVFDLSVTEQVDEYLFLSCGDRHHDLALHEVGAEARVPERYDVGMFHFAVEVAGIVELKAFYHRLRALNIDVNPVDHGISKVLYFKDPDGNGIEIYVDTRHDNKRYVWGGEFSKLDIESL